MEPLAEPLAALLAAVALGELFQPERESDKKPRLSFIAREGCAGWCVSVRIRGDITRTRPRVNHSARGEYDKLTA